jgi:hypothetical protein
MNAQPVLSRTSTACAVTHVAGLCAPWALQGCRRKMHSQKHDSFQCSGTHLSCPILAPAAQLPLCAKSGHEFGGRGPAGVIWNSMAPELFGAACTGVTHISTGVACMFAALFAACLPADAEAGSVTACGGSAEWCRLVARPDAGGRLLRSVLSDGAGSSDPDGSGSESAAAGTAEGCGGNGSSDVVKRGWLANVWVVNSGAGWTAVVALAGTAALGGAVARGAAVGSLCTRAAPLAAVLPLGAAVLVGSVARACTATSMFSCLRG